jgi:hypothetical protein
LPPVQKRQVLASAKKAGKQSSKGFTKKTPPIIRSPEQEQDALADPIDSIDVASDKYAGPTNTVLQGIGALDSDEQVVSGADQRPQNKVLNSQALEGAS